MPRNIEQNAELRETRRLQILDAALSVYVGHGYHGTDMEIVAQEAGLAKGLLYYYFKTKQALFGALFEWATQQAMTLYQGFMEDARDDAPIERLVRFTWDVFGHARIDSRFVRFSMRLPFDASAVFEHGAWEEGRRRSDVHMQMIASAIQQGIDHGDIPPTNAAYAANSFWAVFVSNLFMFTKMIGNTDPAGAGPTWDAEEFPHIVRFCFQGLGLKERDWGPIAARIARGREGEA